ncbi:hypothetical protein LUZ60_001420 [Juncus effusus]|nr:hypothetical protein LUZ60_001420 [Juncus effusus]
MAAAPSRSAAPSLSNSSTISSRWADLSYDLLVSILSRLSSVDLVVGVSSVCSSWRSAARNKHFWRVIDLSDWDSLTVPATFNQVLNRVLGFVPEPERVEEVYFPPVANEHDLFLVSQRLPKLVYLSFPRSKVPGPMAYSALTSLKFLKGIALHEDFFFTAKVLCLPSGMFHDVSELKVYCDAGWLCSHDTMICKVFPKLRKLEMPPRCRITTDAILELLDSLEHLEYLDISGCRMWGCNKRVFEKASRLKVFIWHGEKA